MIKREQSHLKPERKTTQAPAIPMRLPRGQTSTFDEAKDMERTEKRATRNVGTMKTNQALMPKQCKDYQGF